MTHHENLPAGDDPDAPLFAEAFAARQRSPDGDTLANQFHRVLVAAKLVEPRPHTSTGKGRSAKRAPSLLSFHSLRHTATSMLKNAGVSDAVWPGTSSVTNPPPLAKITLILTWRPNGRTWINCRTF